MKLLAAVSFFLEEEDIFELSRVGSNVVLETGDFESVEKIVFRIFESGFVGVRSRHGESASEPTLLLQSVVLQVGCSFDSLKLFFGLIENEASEFLFSKSQDLA